MIGRALGGEASAFGLLYDKYIEKIFRFILVKVGGQREEAEDLTHQVFVKAWEEVRRGAYSEKGYPFGSWLYRIARNLVIDHWRRLRITVDLDESATDLAASEPELGERLDRNQDALALVRAIHRLKDIEQDVLLLRFTEELPVKAVAEALGKTEGAVKLIQHRAIGKLRAMLKP
ncbi:MAG: sigma-70 family RNA polymerase sigma factor [Candidatus Colwellbacteria bacterium]|nr:sigma-70 family RNA polymerase sigma factor [Candidatus Colwellbacteria bacterium]